MKVLAFAASLRKGSINRRLLLLAEDIVRESGHEVDHAEFRDFDMPLYDGDLQAESGIPAGAEALGARIAGADAWLLASPEYNWGMPGTIKNAIDWLSRMQPVPLDRKSVLLMSASPSLVGGARGLMSLRVPLEVLGCWCYPKMFALAQAGQAYGENGKLADQALAAMLRTMIEDYLSAAEALSAR